MIFFLIIFYFFSACNNVTSLKSSTHAQSKNLSVSTKISKYIVVGDSKDFSDEQIKSIVAYAFPSSVSNLNLIGFTDTVGSIVDSDAAKSAWDVGLNLPGIKSLAPDDPDKPSDEGPTKSVRPEEEADGPLVLSSGGPSSSSIVGQSSSISPSSSSSPSSPSSSQSAILSLEERVQKKVLELKNGETLFKKFEFQSSFTEFSSIEKGQAYFFPEQRLSALDQATKMTDLKQTSVEGSGIVMVHRP